ncbi:arsenite efflux transporter metallochaperone ArsD [Alkalihalobacterium bogoriense]|uniref:arsenite efflux transporter metallochaperone ArsD n=1 Tax=Alkalihalobacterium bogoriense TaxID=246272 RepID=UPI00055263F5|nr:arsenite efflux transporter metallochaperone ArsD [Alkalihalobacterium bogoriense]
MKIEIFDPAMCCDTGVCGPNVDPELTRVATAIYMLQQQGISIVRYNLTSEPQAYVDQKEVTQLLEEKGTDSLPIVIVNDKVEKIGEYPTNEELAKWTGLDISLFTKKEKSLGKEIKLL